METCLPGIFSYGETVSKATSEQLSRLPTAILQILANPTNYSNQDPPTDRNLDYDTLRERWIQEKLKNNEWFELNEFRTAPMPIHLKYEECDERDLKKVRRDV
jgi:hypothetical protein